MSLTCIIIEDEPLAIDKLKGFIEKVSFLKLIGIFENPIKSFEFIKNKTIDIIFLDIQMEQMTGIELLESVSVESYIIITSAYADYALKAFELKVFDYLLKPYSFERFMAAIDNVYCDNHKRKEESVPKDYIFVKTEYRIENILLNDILYIEGMHAYLKIHTPDKRIMTKQSFKSILKILPQDKFVQVHKSWIVSISKIESVERMRIKIRDRLIPIGDSYRDLFFKSII